MLYNSHPLNLHLLAIQPNDHLWILDTDCVLTSLTLLDPMMYLMPKENNNPNQPLYSKYRPSVPRYLFQILLLFQQNPTQLLYNNHQNTCERYLNNSWYIDVYLHHINTVPRHNPFCLHLHLDCNPMLPTLLHNPKYVTCFLARNILPLNNH